MIFKKLTEMPPTNSKTAEIILEKFCKGLAIMVGQRKNTFCFIIFRIDDFQKKKTNKGTKTESVDI